MLSLIFQFAFPGFARRKCRSINLKRCLCARKPHLGCVVMDKSSLCVFVICQCGRATRGYTSSYDDLESVELDAMTEWNKSIESDAILLDRLLSEHS